MWTRVGKSLPAVNMVSTEPLVGQCRAACSADALTCCHPDFTFCSSVMDGGITFLCTT